MIKLRSGRRGPAVLAATVALLAVVAGLATAYLRSAPTASMDGVDGLLRSRRFDEAERKIGEFLRVNPSDDRANLLMAQVALGRDDQKPSMALEHLARVRSDAPAFRAIVLLNQGKAYSSLGRHEAAEAAWLDALRADRLVPEAGWALLGLYYVEERRAEARTLGLALHAVEPDPRDRVQLLLELLRQDAKPIVGFSVINVFGPVVREHPEETHAAIALARALIREDRPDEAIPILERLVARDPESPLARETLLIGLDEASRLDELPEDLARLPRSIADDPRFARFRGIVAKDRGDWKTAVDEYRRARRFDPSDAQVAYRLSRALRLAGRVEEAAQAEEEFRLMNTAGGEALALYNEANALPTFCEVPQIDLYRRISILRERMGHRAEALAWHRLILRANPDDTDSLNAAGRFADLEMPTIADFLAANSKKANHRSVFTRENGERSQSSRNRRVEK